MHPRIFLALCLLTLPLHAAPPTPVFEPTGDEYDSDTETTIVRVYHDPKSAWNTLQFRVYYEQGAYITAEDKARQAKNGQVLWQGDNRASALVSFDGESILINHHANSDLGELLVFQRRPNGSYEKLNVDFQKEALPLLIKDQKLPKPPELYKVFCVGETWLNDHSFLAFLRIQTSGKTHLPDFWFIYDCTTQHFSFDLHKINQTSQPFDLEVISPGK